MYEKKMPFETEHNDKSANLTEDISSCSSNLLVETFKRYGHLSNEIVSEIMSKTKRISRTKGSFIVRQGQIASGLYVIEKGLVRAFYKKDNQEIAIWFGYEGINFASIASFFDNKPSREVIQCLEDSIFQYISGKDLRMFYNKYPEMSIISRKMTEEYCIILDDRTFSFQTQSAEERYKELLENDPEIVRRVPLGYIASYLGISQETLSRVRKKLTY